jgi:hypothetical protein
MTAYPEDVMKAAREIARGTESNETRMSIAARAILAERERAAKVADARAARRRSEAAWCREEGQSTSETHAKEIADEIEEIAAAIRKGGIMTAPCAPHSPIDETQQDLSIMDKTPHPIDEAIKVLTEIRDEPAMDPEGNSQIAASALPALTAYREGMGEPVGWRYEYKSLMVGDWIAGYWDINPSTQEGFNSKRHRNITPLYLSPPDASALAEEVKRLRKALDGLVDEIEARASGLHTGQWDAALANARSELAKEPTHDTSSTHAGRGDRGDGKGDRSSRVVSEMFRLP